MSEEQQTSVRSIFIVLWIALFAAMIGLGIMAPLLPTYATTMGASSVMLGFIFGGFSLARMFAMPVIGRWSDRSGRKKFIVAGLAIETVAALAFIACQTPWQLLLTRMFQGLAGAMIIPISMAYIGELSPKGRESYYMGWFSVALFAGFGAGPIFGGIIEDHLSFNTNFIFLGALCFIGFLGVLFGLKETGRTDHNKLSRTEVTYRALLKNPVLRGLFIFRIANSFGRGVIAAFLPLIGEHTYGLTTTQVGIVLSGNFLAVAVFQPLFGHLADRFNRTTIIILGNLLQAVTIAAVLHFSTFTGLLAVNILMGLSGAMAIPAASGMITTEGKKGGMGGAMALFNIGMSTGLASGPIVGGFLVDYFGYQGAFYFGAVAVMLGIIPVAAVARYLKRNNGYNSVENLEGIG